MQLDFKHVFFDKSGEAQSISFGFYNIIHVTYNI